MKKIKKPKKRVSLYISLLFSYIALFIVLIIIFVFSIIAVYSTMFKGVADNDFPYSIDEESKAKSSTLAISNLGGWIEKLDKDYNVVQVYGNKQNNDYQYTVEDMLKLTSSDWKSLEPYIGFVNKTLDSSESYMVVFRRLDITVQYNFNPSYSNPNALWIHKFILLFVILSLITILIITYIIYRKIKLPLEKVKNAIRNIEKYEEDYFTNTRVDLEIAAVFDELSFMSKTLKYSKKEKLELENKRENMILELSHDIKTPIATINSYSAALEEDMVSEEDKKKYYKVIRRKAQRVNLLLEDMFTMLKLKSSDYELNKTTEDICEFLRKECAEYYSDAEMHGLNMEVEIPEHKVLYEADYILFSRVVGNIISNSIKYNKTGNKVKIHLSCENGEKCKILMSVSDDGLPIDKNVRYSMFDEFSRGDAARKTDGGTGLGLSIAKAIIERHKGNISYQYKNGENIFIIFLNI